LFSIQLLFFGAKTKELDVDITGYTPLDKNFIFKDLKVYGNEMG